MVLLTLTPASKAAVAELCKARRAAQNEKDDEFASKLARLSESEPGSPIDHADLVKISRQLLANTREDDDRGSSRDWRLDSLLKGATVYQEPPPPKAESTAEYKSLMKRLRAEEEQRQYERMINASSSNEAASQGLSNVARGFNPATSIGQAVGADEIDEVTFADVNRQVALIINVLVSIIACSIAIWVAARRWDVPQRLGLSMSGSGVVAVAEVVIYMGYIRRIKDAKVKERKQVETKEVVESWVLDGSSSNAKSSEMATVRHRKGKHR